MRAPDASNHRHSPEWLRSLIDDTGLTQAAVATRIGIAPRTLRGYLEDGPGGFAAPYPVVFCLEQLAEWYRKEKRLIRALRKGEKRK